VVCWFERHPRCGLYLRQLPIPGVDTKFFETNRSILDDLLTAALAEHVDLTVTRFSERHGLRHEEPLIRLRFLDPALQAARGFPVDDLAVPVSAFRSLPLSGARVVITENLRNFLALPALPKTVAVYGGGNAVSLLAGATWLVESELLYWGDIDAHGFLILGRLRGLFPHVASIMMDAATLAVAPELTGKAAPIEAVDSPRLTPDEALLFAQLRDGNVGMEQERVPWDYALTQLALSTAMSHV
jgi:hypothetical protein